MPLPSVQIRSFWIGRDDNSLSGVNQFFKELVLTPEQLIDLEVQKSGQNWSILTAKFEQDVPPRLISSSIHSGAWFHEDYMPTEIVLTFDTPISDASIVNGTFKLIDKTSITSVNAADVTVDKEMVTISFVITPGYNGPLTLVGSGFKGQHLRNAEAAVNIPFTVGSSETFPVLANSVPAPDQTRMGVVRISRLLVPFGTRPDTMYKQFLRTTGIAPDQVIKTVIRGNQFAVGTEVYVAWYPKIGARMVSATPALFLPSENVPSRLVLNFDRPVQLTTSEVTATGPGGPVTLTLTALDTRKTQWTVLGDYTDPGQYKLVLSGIKDTNGDSLGVRQVLGWQVMPTEMGGTAREPFQEFFVAAGINSFPLAHTPLASSWQVYRNGVNESQCVSIVGGPAFQFGSGTPNVGDAILFHGWYEP